MIERGKKVCLAGANSGGVPYPVIIGEVCLTHEDWVVVVIDYPEKDIDGVMIDDFEASTDHESFFSLLANHEKRYIG